MSDCENINEVMQDRRYPKVVLEIVCREDGTYTAVVDGTNCKGETERLVFVDEGDTRLYMLLDRLEEACKHITDNVQG